MDLEIVLGAIFLAPCPLSLCVQISLFSSPLAFQFFVKGLICSYYSLCYFLCRELKNQLTSQSLQPVLTFHFNSSWSSKSQLLYGILSHPPHPPPSSSSLHQHRADFSLHLLTWSGLSFLLVLALLSNWHGLQILDFLCTSEVVLSYIWRVFWAHMCRVVIPDL